MRAIGFLHKNRLFYMVLSILIIISGYPSLSLGAKLPEGTKGKITFSDYYSNDSEGFNFHLLMTRLNLYKYEDEQTNHAFNLDFRFREKIFNGKIMESVPEYRFDEAWISYRLPKWKLKISAGRQYVYELYNTRIDGVNLKYSFKPGLGVGIFGGLAPDKLDESLNTDYTSIGLYGFLEKEQYRFHLGYEHLKYNGDTDREYFSLKVYSKFNDKLRMNAISSASINQITNNLEVENANINFIYSYSKRVRFNIFYNYYRTIKYYASSVEYLVLPDLSSSFLLDNNSQTRTGVRVDYKIMKKLKVYGSIAYQHRKLDNGEALRLTAGLRKYDFYGFDISGRYTHINDFSSVSDEFNIEVTRNFMNKIDVSLYASREEEKLDTKDAYTSGALTYGASAYWPINRSYYLSAFLEYYESEDYDNTSLFSQLGYKF